MAHLLRMRVDGGAEVRERDHGHARLEVEPPGRLRRQDGDLGELLGVGVDVHRRVREDEHLSLEHQQVSTGDVLDAGAGLDDLQRWADGGGVVGMKA